MTARRAPVSVCIVAMNEADRIEDCLRSVAFADEVIVIDSHSTDATRSIAERLGARVIERDWPGHIEQKNFALEQANSNWVLSVDADERVSPELAAEIRGVLSQSGSAEAGCSMPRKTYYLGRWITHGGWYPDRKLRLVRRGAGMWKGVNPHDHLYVEGPVARLNGDLHHYTYRDISDHLATIDKFTTIAAGEMRARGQGHPLAHMLLNPPAKFLKMYLLRVGFLDGLPGFVVAVLSSYYVFLKYAKLWELRRAGKQAP